MAVRGRTVALSLSAKDSMRMDKKALPNVHESLPMDVDAYSCARLDFPIFWIGLDDIGDTGRRSGGGAYILLASMFYIHGEACSYHMCILLD